MGRPVETLSLQKNSSFTVEQIGQQIKKIDGQQQFLLDLLTPNDNHLKTVDWKEHPALFREAWRLSSRKSVLSAIHREGEGIEGLFDQEISLAEPPVVVTSEVLHDLTKRGLDFIPNPAFPVKDPKQLQAIVDGRSGYSPLLEVFPESYLRGVLGGQIAYPHLSGYYEAVDAAGSSTELSRGLGIKNLHTSSIPEINDAIVHNERDLLQGWNIDPRKAYIRASVTAKELLMREALRGEQEQRVTYTRLRGTTEHIVFDGKAMSTRARSEAGIPPRLAIVFSTRPDNVAYLKSKENV